MSESVRIAISNHYMSWCMLQHSAREFNRIFWYFTKSLVLKQNCLHGLGRSHILLCHWT